MSCRGTFASNAQGRKYGFKQFGDYFTSRQLTALALFSDLIHEIKGKVVEDAVEAGIEDDGVSLNAGDWCNCIWRSPRRYLLFV